MVISKFNDILFVVLNIWYIKQYKLFVFNVFMVCGVLYVIRILSIRIEEIFYYYDINIGKEGRLEIVMYKMQENVYSINYYFFDYKFYVYNDGYFLNYDVIFKREFQ